MPRRPGAEVTVECNPEDVTAERLATYRPAGVTRISLGVQSTVGHVLEGLGRRHGPDHVVEAAGLVAEAGFDSWNLDLIIGGAGERDEDWERSLSDLLGPGRAAAPPQRLRPDRRAGHPARPHAGPAPRRRRPGRPLRDGRPGARRRPATGGRRSPTGPGPATSAGTTTSTGTRATTGASGRRPTPTRAAAGGGTSAPRTATWPWWGRTGRTVAGEEVLDAPRRAFEALALGLRTSAGVPLDALPDHPDLDGLVDRSSGRAVLTVRGRLLANAVTGYLAARD